MDFARRAWNYLTSDITLIREGGILFSATLIANIINYVFQFSMGRLLGPKDYGIFGVLFAIIYLLLAPINTIQTVITKFVSEFRARNEFEKISGLFWRSLRKVFFCSLIIFALFVIFGEHIARFLNFPSSAPVIIFSIFILLAFVIPVLRGFLQGLQHFKMLGVNVVLEMGMKLVLGVAFVLLGWKVVGALFGVILGALFAFVVAFASLRKIYATKTADFPSQEIYRYSLPVFVGMLAIAGMYTFDVILVKHYFNPLDAGHYVAASLLAKIIFFASIAISQVMFPKVAELYAKGDKYKPIFNKALFFVFAMSAVAVVIYFVAPNFVVSLLFGKEYLMVAPLIGLFSLAMGLFSLCYVIVNYLLSINKTKVVALPILFCIAEVFLVFLFHSSLMQIVKILCVVMALLLASLLITNRHEVVPHHTRIQ